VRCHDLGVAVTRSVSVGFVLLAAIVVAAMSLGATRAAAPRVSGAPRLHAFEATPIATDLDLVDLVPPAGRLDHVWYVPAGRGVPRVVVGWHFEALRKIPAWADPRRYVVTVWTPRRLTRGSAWWVPTTLIRASPFPLSGESIRLSDVTGDGVDDLLVTVVCSECNHATAVASIYAERQGAIRKIYGTGVISVAKGPGPNAEVHGRLISETAWGARGGLVWFDEPRGGSAVCCPAYRLQTFLRWTGHGWTVVSRRRVSPRHDSLIRHGFPAV
jgi:hypothetical protein